MGALTEFFVASPKELKWVLPAWLPVRAEPSTREVVNPFTGKRQVVNSWLPAIEPPMGAAASGPPDYSRVPHVRFQRVDQVKLAKLCCILTGCPFVDGLKQFIRPALIDPAQSEETGVHLFDSTFADRLASIGKSELPVPTKKWAETEEMQRDRFRPADCELVLRSLAQLARQARQSAKGLYFWWSV
jgi:hypothetical protein